MATHPEPSALGAPPQKAPSRRLGVLRFQQQVHAIDHLIYDYDPHGTGSSPDDPNPAYEGAAVEVMRALRDAEVGRGDAGDAIRSVIPKAGHELVAKIIEAWSGN